MNVNDSIRSQIPRKNTLDYNSYSDYEILPSMFDSTNQYSGLSKTLTQQLKTHNQYYGTEGFDNHGYNSQPQMGNDNNRVSDAINNNQVTPLDGITRDYINTVTQINSNYNDIDQNLSKVNQLRTQLNIDANANNVYDFAGDKLKYYNGVNNADKKTPTVQDALNEDVKSMILEQNTIYILGSITAASLLIFAIFLGK
jgi:hypothetical protein